MKAKLAAILCASLLFTLAACHHVRCEPAPGPYRIVASTFPVWLFTANIIRNSPNIRLELLIPATAGCPHDFSLKPADLQKLVHADALVINGAGLEEFLAKPLAAMEKKPEIIDAGLNVPVLDDSGHDQTHINPHIFAAPGEACLMVRNIAAALAAMDKENADLYAQNASVYMEKLAALSGRLERMGQKAKNRVIVLEHNGLAYLAANAGLTIAAILEPPLSPAALAETGKVIAETKPALLAGESQYPDRALQTLAAETGVPCARLNTCASGPDNAPLDYYEREMENNLKTLEKYFD